MARILIVEDEPLIARDLKRILTKNDYEIVGICYNSDVALDQLALENYDLVLLDIHLKGSRNGIELAEIINAKYNKPFIFITSFADKDTIDQVKVVQPRAYIVKPFSEREIYSSVEIALYNDSKQLSETMTLEYLNESLLINITPKEFEVIQLIKVGKTNGQMSSDLFVSQNTIKTHVKSIYLKLKVNSKAELVSKVFSKFQ